MLFGVKLIEVPPLAELSGFEVFDLMVNARHIAGPFWCYEGDEFVLHVHDVHVRAEGVTEGFGDYDDSEFVKHCEEAFGVDLLFEPPAWKMLKADRARLPSA